MPENLFSLNLAELSYEDRLTAAGLEGLANRERPQLMLDWGRYDDVADRTTNEVFIPDDVWQAKYKEFIGFQDRENQKFYEKTFKLKFSHLKSLTEAIKKYRQYVAGIVVWDPEQIDTVNVAIMLAGLEDLLILSPDQLETGLGGDLPVVHDLRGRWTDRISLYRWADQQLRSRCQPGKVACVEPGWHRPEFVDYLVRERIFTYSLGTGAAQPLAKAGQTLLLLLVVGPSGLRNILFNLHLEGLIRGLGLLLMGLGNPEARLATQIQRKTTFKPFPTIFGWHTKREDEFSFMLHLSSNGLRLIPSHMAGNFSFHASVPCDYIFTQPQKRESDVVLEPDKVYLTFTLSDGDQLLLMNIRENGNWDRKERGKVAFNWEVQPYLVEMAPALYSRYYRTLTPQDYLLAGPSGAGYVVPPIMRHFRRYLKETDRICREADIKVLTSYIADPPRRIIRETVQGTPDFTGYLAGYLHFGRYPQVLVDGKPFIANQWPPLEEIAADTDQVLAGVRALVESSEDKPAFIAVHLFAYRTTITDIYKFAASLDPDRVKVVKADEFLLAAKAYYSEKEKER